MNDQLLHLLQQGDIKSLARAITLVENEQPGYQDLLRSLPSHSAARIAGITGPPGAGKSTVVDGIIGEWVKRGEPVAVLCVDPSSPFNLGAVLGDRIRMSRWYTHPNVFIRSLATRGSVGGLSPKIIETTELVKSAGFERIIVETVGVGQSEIEIAGLADVTVVVVVPEGGDEVQTMKAGLMEIADIFVINKSDRPDAEVFERNLRQMLAPSFSRHTREVPVLRTVATEKKGIEALVAAIENEMINDGDAEKRIALLTDRAWHLLVQKRMSNIKKTDLRAALANAYNKPAFNLYSFVEAM